MGKKKSKKPKKAGKLANDVYLYDHNGNARLDRMICREYLWKMVELTSHNYHRTYNYYNSNCSSSQISDQKNDNNVITVDFSDTSNEITTDKSNCYEVNDTNSYNYDGIDVDSVVEYETIDTSEAELLGLPVSFKSNKHIYFGDNGQNYDANDIDRDRNCPVGYLTTLSNSSRNSLLINNTIPKSDNSSIKKKKKKRKVSKTIHDFIFDNNKLIIENNICGIDPLWFIDNSEEASKLFTVLKPDGYYSVNTGKKGIDVSEDSSSNFILRILGNAPSYTANCQTVVAQVVDKEFTTTNRIAIDRKYLVPIDVNNLQLVADYVEAIKNCLLEDPHAVRPKGVPIKYWIQRYGSTSVYSY